MRPINYLEIDYIYNRIATEIQEIVAEDRITEWVGEVMEFIRTPLKQEKGIYVLKVDNWQAEFPRGLHTLINVARFNGCLPQNLSLCCGEEKEQTEHKHHSHTHHHTCTSCTPPSNTETINNSQNEDNIINTILPFVVKKNKSIAGRERMLMMGGNPYNATSLLCFDSATATQPLNLENIETSSFDIRIKFQENIVFGANPHVEIYTDNCLGGSHVGHIYSSSMWIDNNDTLVINYPPNNHPNFSFSNSLRIKITENTILGQDFVLEWTVFKQDSINPVKPINVYPAAFSSVPVYTDYVDVTFNSSITPVSLQNPNGIKIAESNTLPSVNVRDYNRDPEMISNDTIRFYIHNLQPEKFYTVLLDSDMIVEMGGEGGESPYALSWCFSTKSCPISFYTLTVHYLSATNHSEVAASYVENFESGQDYSVLSPDLTSQHLYTDQPVVSGFMPEEDLDIQVFYWEEGQCIGSDIQVLNINLITSSSFETAHVVIKFNYELDKNFPLTTNDITIQGGKKPATINFNNIQYESNQCSIAIENLEADTEYFIEIEPNVFSADYSEKPYLCYIQFSFKTKKKKTDYECDCKDPCDCCNDFIFIQHPYIPLNLAVTEENKEIEFLRVANRPYFESDPCMGIKNTSCRHEYSIVGTTERQFRLSFESGYILVSGYQIALDKRGLPLIIDMPDVINAIIYYIKWKVSEFKWMNDPTVQQNHLVQYNRQMYEKYCKQSKTALKMPHGVDDYHDLLEFQNRISTDSFYYTFFNRTIKLK